MSAVELDRRRTKKREIRVSFYETSVDSLIDLYTSCLPRDYALDNDVPQNEGGTVARTKGFPGEEVSFETAPATGFERSRLTGRTCSSR